MNRREIETQNFALSLWKRDIFYLHLLLIFHHLNFINMWPNALLSAGYFFLGLLTGYISGISESEISKIILGTLLAFFGGKLFFEIQKKDDTVKKNIGAVIIGFSIAFLISFNVGIYVKVNRVFTPAKYRDSAIWHDVQKNNPYVRSFTAPVDSSKK